MLAKGTNIPIQSPYASLVAVSKEQRFTSRVARSIQVWDRLPQIKHNNQITLLYLLPLKDYKYPHSGSEIIEKFFCVYMDGVIIGLQSFVQHAQHLREVVLVDAGYRFDIRSKEMSYRLRETQIFRPHY
ncbi:hypothetical protein TNCV_253551 [Trichonephila clavipes]|nr:hypothetical protein TNCV_253551 [Trichonephila clavipes]